LPPAFTFTRAERLSGSNAFDRVFQNGRAFRRRKFVLLAAPNQGAVSRLGLSVGRKLGPALRRNRLKRLIREAFRLNKSALSAPMDLVVIPRREWRELRLSEIEADFGQTLAEVRRFFERQNASAGPGQPPESATAGS